MGLLTRLPTTQRLILAILGIGRADISDRVGRQNPPEMCWTAKNTWYGPLLGGLRPLKQWCSVLTKFEAGTSGMRGPSVWCLRLGYRLVCRPQGTKRARNTAADPPISLSTCLAVVEQAWDKGIHSYFGHYGTRSGLSEADFGHSQRWQS